MPRGAPNFSGRKQLQSETENGESDVLALPPAERISHGLSGHRDVNRLGVGTMSKITSIVEKMLLGAAFHWS